MKIVNHTGMDLKLFIGQEGAESPEGMLHLKDNQEYIINDGTKLLYVIDKDKDEDVTPNVNVKPISS